MQKRAPYLAKFLKLHLIHFFLLKASNILINLFLRLNTEKNYEVVEEAVVENARQNVLKNIEMIFPPS